MSTGSYAAELFRRLQCPLDEAAEALSRADIAALQRSMMSLESLSWEMSARLADGEDSPASFEELRASCAVLLRSLARCSRTIHMLQAAETSITGQYHPLEG